MNEREIEISNIIKRHTGIEVGEVNQKFADIGVDSLSFISIIIEIETMFQIEIPPQKLTMKRMSTIKEIEKVIEECMDKEDRDD